MQALELQRSCGAGEIRESSPAEQCSRHKLEAPNHLEHGRDSSFVKTESPSRSLPGCFHLIHRRMAS
jgi:hypothetical protein